MRKIACLLAVAAVSACETAHPDIALDEAPMTQAKAQSFDRKPLREIIETATPYPLPGQLKPIDEEEDTAQDLQPFERIDQANERAKIEPDLDRFVNAVQVYPFMDGALYRLYAAPEQVTDIALEPGERLNSVSAGDTVRWIVGDTSSGGVGGSGGASGERVHILVKPIAPNLKTNLIIATDRRAYHLEMRSFRETYMAAVSWTYANDQLVRRRQENGRAVLEAASTVSASVSPDNLKFRYEIEGDKPHWRPVRAFDDGRQVFIQFPENIAQGEAPPLFVLSAKGEPELVNYRMRGNYYVVDRLFAAAELRLGEKPQAVVRIIRTDRKRRS